ncbi:TPA: ATP-dependent RNA helicase DbpA [Legionella pneumophila]|uniref:ATP-dependent RNA helicase DbpA n=1 Tax=Legionella pneumophila TaxID=446 RepID=UPI00078731EE|nr:ATP-dependent RNA helicase DbpA [Legionella pneumophila]MDW8877632.1 ATP-dependent RNA helicase DbpA [Legionella pneumophila subsp. fraseri]MDW8960671.1 ATP-dependent RNA helicase DbpA [Legionella pneumophila subsp. fraseri]MDW9035306.1 ATP-dependent RNA helicase DbpA [Legionella pneumophila subsp. fraseri]MDW9038367.1 ATP-dependent RNA helicase DbpA [Legionella pneumophila subsp. fraseri]MDW9041428.1 ATP-dependent RNA helicase DbpA [Legionella pneumophila subsp. fraseri]
MIQSKHSDQYLSFAQFPLRQELIKSLASSNYENMTPIQMQSLPIILRNEDIIAQAKTGSGKTVAFALSLLNNLKISFFAVQGLVLCPTRELAEQVSQAIRRLACLMPNVKIINLSGGIPMKPQLDSLRHGAHIIVGTPGRILKHLKNTSLDLTHVKALVLDEADRMLDMGFFDDIKNIISICPTQRQTLLFSATYPEEIKQLSKQFMKNPKEVYVETLLGEIDIEQYFYEVTKQAQKFPLLKSLLLHYRPVSTLIFCNTKQQTADVTDQLIHEGFSAIALNGDMEQIDRDLAVLRFANQSCAILVATDVAARGLDIKELPAVINFDLAFDHDVHIHRIGRTGRAGRKGIALNITTPADAQRICAIKDNLPHPINWGNMNTLENQHTTRLEPEMVTLALTSGKKDKIRPGDILGALTKDAGIAGNTIGKINITATYSYVAIHHSQADKAYEYLQHGKLKGRKVNVRKIN